MRKFLPNKIKSSGFTLIELLIALAIVTILAVAVSVALNPAKRLNDAQDARRTVDVESILTAIHQAIIDNKGDYPTGMPAVDVEKQLGTPAGGCVATTVGACTVTAGCADLMTNAAIDLIPYLASMPVDPDSALGTVAASGYSVKRDTNGIVTVKACHTTDPLVPITASR